jgi:glycosyltransferase involved in cell wall biosynthesis
MKSWPLGFVLRRAWGIVGTGEKATARYQDLIGKGVPRTSVPYYIDLKDFQRLPLPPPPGNRGTLKFLACCQLIHRKGLDVLLDACSQLNGSDWKLTIVGDGPLRKKLEREGNLRFAPGQVRFVGEIPYGQRGEAFSGHHVFVFSSRWDGWGMVLPEALAAGLPVVATDQVMAAHEFIRPGVNGFVVPANDAGSLAEKMRHWMDHPETLSSMATAARQSVENYRPEVGAERLVLFLQSLLSKPHRAG